MADVRAATFVGRPPGKRITGRMVSQIGVSSVATSQTEDGYGTGEGAGGGAGAGRREGTTAFLILLLEVWREAGGARRRHSPSAFVDRIGFLCLRTIDPYDGLRFRVDHRFHTPPLHAPIGLPRCRPRSRSGFLRRASSPLRRGGNGIRPRRRPHRVDRPRGSRGRRYPDPSRGPWRGLARDREGSREGG